MSYSNEVTYTLSASIDGENITNYIDSISIVFSVEQYVNYVNISFNNDNWNIYNTLCNPETNYGTERIIINLDGDEYKFLLEKRDTNINNTTKSFNIWGRQKVSLLSENYADPITNTEDSLYPWQSSNMLASEIINYLLIGTGISIAFNIDDYVVYSKNFNPNNVLPIEIIKELVNVPGGRLYSDYNGNLVADYKPYLTIQNNNTVCDYTDVDEIISISDDVEKAKLFNKIKIIGISDYYEKDTLINIESYNSNRSCISKTRPFKIKVYISPFYLNYTINMTNGIINQLDEEYEELEEVLQFNDGVSSTSKPIYDILSQEWFGNDLGDISYIQGYTGIESEEKSIGILNITYRTKYDVYECRVDEAGTVIIYAQED